MLVVLMLRWTRRSGRLSTPVAPGLAREDRPLGRQYQVTILLSLLRESDRLQPHPISPVPPVTTTNELARSRSRDAVHSG
jgi:hypothetical protein